jgi:predicted nucleic acid-binding protein
MSYVDTSIIVAALDYLDPRRELALEILEKKEEVYELITVDEDFEREKENIKREHRRENSC